MNQFCVTVPLTSGSEGRKRQNETNSTNSTHGCMAWGIQVGRRQAVSGVAFAGVAACR
jgi:hypothetical protein